MKTKRAAFEVEAATLDELCDKVYGIRSDEVRDGTEVRMPASMMLRHTITVSLLRLWITSLTLCCLNLSNPGLSDLHSGSLLMKRKEIVPLPERLPSCSAACKLAC